MGFITIVVIGEGEEEGEIVITCLYKSRVCIYVCGHACVRACDEMKDMYRRGKAEF